MGLFSKLFSNNNNVTVVNTQQPEVYNVQAIHEQIKVDPNYRAATTQPSIFLNGNYSGNVTVFSFLGINWTVTTQDGIVSIQTTGGGGGGSFVVKKDGTVIVASTTNLNFTGTNITVQQDSVNLNQANISVTGGGGGNQASFSYILTPTTGQLPLIANITDLTQPVPTGYNYTVLGGVQGTNWNFTNGTVATTQNPQITFLTLPVSPSTAYTVTSSPTGSVTYTPFSVAITPTPATVIVGDFTVALAFGSPAGALSKPYFNYASTDVFAVAVNKINAETCVSVSSSQIIVTGSPPPNLTVTAGNINSGATVTSDVIGLPNFPAVYKALIDAVMNNSDGTTTDKDNSSNNVSYYVPAFWIQTQSVNTFVFSTTNSQQVVQGNYVAGQSLLFAGGNDIQVIWVAFPPTRTSTTPPQAFVILQGFPPIVISRISDTPAPQTINGLLYNIYGFQLGTTGNLTLTSSLYLETAPTVEQYVSNNNAVQTQLFTNTVAPKKSLFAKLFGV